MQEIMTGASGLTLLFSLTSDRVLSLALVLGSLLLAAWLGSLILI